MAGGFHTEVGGPEFETAVMGMNDLVNYSDGSWFASL